MVIIEIIGLKNLLLLGCLALIGMALKSSFLKGFLGEFLVKLLLHSKLSDTSHILHDVTLPAGEGTTQIDHIVVSPNGVFVIETKNFKGWIFGGEKQRTWVQKIYKNNYRFQNPIHQNYKHIRVLADLLSLPVDDFLSVVVFVGGGTFKTRMPTNVLKLGGLVKYIQTHKSRAFSKEEMAVLVADIKENSLKPSMATKRKHAAYLKAKKRSRNIRH